MEPDVKLILDGDMEGSHVEIPVWHQVMINASPYFRLMLAPGRFAEGTALQNEKSATIPLPETNAEAMKILCDIFHHRTNDIPVSTITSEQLFQIAVLVSRYDCANSVLLWSKTWLDQDPIKNEIERIEKNFGQTSTNTLLKWICIFENLRQKSKSSAFISAVILYHTAHELANSDNDNNYYDHLEPHIIDNIRGVRLTTITGFHKIVMHFAEILEPGDSCRHNEPQDRMHTYYQSKPNTTVDSFNCSSISLGNFLLATRTELGSNWRTLEEWNGSVAATHQRMKRIGKQLNGPAQIAVGGLLNTRDRSKSHASCCRSSSFNDRVKEVMELMGGGDPRDQSDDNSR